VVSPDDEIVLGFHGSFSGDASVIVGAVVSQGNDPVKVFMVKLWEKDIAIHDDEWQLREAGRFARHHERTPASLERGDKLHCAAWRQFWFLVSTGLPGANRQTMLARAPAEPRVLLLPRPARCSPSAGCHRRALPARGEWREQSHWRSAQSAFRGPGEANLPLRKAESVLKIERPPAVLKGAKQAES
jgi:hypothetical protein